MNEKEVSHMLALAFPRRPRTKRRHLEHPEQVALFQWAAFNYAKMPELEMLLFAIPNAGKREGGAGPWMVAEGLKSGVFDTFLAVARQDCHGMFIEMKAGRNKLSDNQQRFKQAVDAQSFAAVVCYSWIEAAHEIVDYLGVEGVRI